MDEEPVFKLDAGDTYERLCCELYITHRRVLVFHCAICENIYGSFALYLKHSLKEHFHDDPVATNEIKLQEKQVELINSNSNNIDSTNEMSESWASEELNHIVEENNFVERQAVKIKCVDVDRLIYRSSSKIETETETNVEGTIDVIEEVVDEDVELCKPEVIYLTDCAPSGTKRKPLPVYPCKICDRTFSIKKKLDVHYASEHPTERRYRCEVCGATFTLSCNLGVHMRRHNEKKKRYGCNECEMRFHTRPELKSHVRHHTGEKPFICPQCGLQFFTSGNLHAHLQRHSETKPHQCDQCEKAYYEAYRLKEHMSVHTGKRKHICSVCNLGFIKKHKLNEHLKIHANKREHKCDICQAGFNQKQGLFAHLRNKHKKKSSKLTEKDLNIFV